MTTTHHHPEQLDEEIYLGNMTEHDFDRSSWGSKRLGRPIGTRFGYGAESYHPVFILASELEDRIRIEESARGPNHEEKIRLYRQMLAERRVILPRATDSAEVRS